MEQAARVAVSAVLAFVVLDLVAVLLATDAYSARSDYVSSLAGRGSSVWPVEVAGLALFAVAHLALAVVLVLGRRLQVAALVVGLAGLVLGAVSVLRTGCPGGEAHCAFAGNTTSDWVTSAHGMTAGGYMQVMVVAMLVAAVSAYRVPGALRWALLAGVPLAALAAYSLDRLGGQGPTGDTGLWERIWLASNAAWILLVALATPRPDASVS